MHCEICGREIYKGAVPVKIEGSLMRTCRACSRLGEKMAPPKEFKPSPRPSFSRPVKKEVQLELAEDYAKVLRQHRKEKGLTQDDVGQEINEKGSVIQRIESGHMVPDIKLARKLERFFDITLLEELE